MSAKLRVVHYLNQFFAGVGGEERSDHPVSARPGPVGPGVLLDKILGEDAEVVGTVFAGDGLFAENEGSCAAEAIARIKEFAPDLVLAGPAFNAGRYGLACAAVCRAAQEAGIPVVTAMHPENPGFPAAGTGVHTVPAADSAVGMEEALEAATRLGRKLARGGVRSEAPPMRAIYRAVSATTKSQNSRPHAAPSTWSSRKSRGSPTRPNSTFPRWKRSRRRNPSPTSKKPASPSFQKAAWSPPATPDRFSGSRNGNWATYSFEGKNALPGGTFISIHGGFNTVFVNEEPDRMLAVDAFRRLADEGEIAELHDDFLSTCGNGGAFVEMDGIGRAWAAELKKTEVEGVVLPAT